MHRKYTGENSVAWNKGNRCKTDDVQVLLSRVKWTNKYHSRINYKLRYFIYACIICALINCLLDNPNGVLYIQMVFIVWMVLFSLHGYFRHHADKYAHYYINDDITEIQKLLKMTDVNITTCINTDPVWAECHNYI